jgi:penicillin amidase
MPGTGITASRARRGIGARTLRILRRVVGALVLVVLLLVAGVAGLIYATLPARHDTTRIPGLSAPVEIGFDADGVPRIKAANALDGAAALGWVHARDRMFQMELMRRAVSGRLSELAGPVTLPIDRQMRVLGLRVRAVADAARLPPPVRAMLDAYAAGVNAWIDAHGRFSAPEFLVFGKPEPWTAVDSLLWGKTMALYLSGNWRTELARLSLAGRLPPARIDALWPRLSAPQADAALTPPPDPAARETAARVLAALPRFPDPFTLPDEASNEWAVSGAHSATGAPLLAGDPHLGFSLPGIWYLARIQTPDGVLAGATAPGVPFLVIGHNGHIAWTFTTTGADTEDLFIETPDGPDRYQTPDGPRPYTLREERILVRGAPDTVITVRETRHGPVVSDVRATPGNAVLALASTALEGQDTAAEGLLALNQARDVAAAMAAGPLISAPVQNLLVADRQHIGLAVTGRVPIRRAGDGSAPVPGADGAHDWTGIASGEALPHFLDPPSGRLVNANEPLVEPSFPVFMGRDAFGDWRAQRIRQLLGAQGKLTASAFARMQSDVGSSFAAQVLPTLRAAHPSTELARQALALLNDWNGSMARDLPQPLIFNTWLAAFEGKLARRADVPPEAGANWVEVVASALSSDGSEWCGGSCETLVAEALDQAAEVLGSRFGQAPALWRWGQVHQAVFAHPLLGRLPLLNLLATARIDAPGDDTTIDRGGLGPGDIAVHGASFRGAYDLADLEASRFIVAPGQSGNIFRAHASDFLARWRDGATVTLAPSDGPAIEDARLLP